MNLLKSLFSSSGDPASSLEDLRHRFGLLRELLDQNNLILGTIGDMEEKVQGEFLFDLAYIRSSLAEIRGAVDEIVSLMIQIGGEKYETLRARSSMIDAELQSIMPGGRSVAPGPYVLRYDRIGRIHSHSTGSKNAVLGEIRGLGLRTPVGFAITAWAYRCFLDHGSIQERINDLLDRLDIQEHRDLEKASGEIIAMIREAEIPEDLAREIVHTHGEMTARCCPGGNVALRSSAIGEDSLFSFAGQYRSYLNVPAGEILERYKEIVASKFTPRAIYYYLSHGLHESELAMSVGCTEMVDAVASGVMYTRDPINAGREEVLVHAIPGLGPYLVEGRLNPDVFELRRDPCELISATVEQKSVMLVASADGGVEERPVPEDRRSAPVIGEETLLELAEIARRLEEHFDQPQDVEWALDGEGRLFVLQSRPLRILCERPDTDEPDLSGLRELAKGGTTVCPGAGMGPVVHVSPVSRLRDIPVGSVLLSRNPFPELGQLLGHAVAVVSEAGNAASHLATLARESRTPTLVGMGSLLEALPEGEVVTVDATGRAIYAGAQQTLVSIRTSEYDLFEDTAIFELLRRLLGRIAPLNLVSPKDPDFRPERCQTFHDITRYAHQRAIEEVFSYARTLQKHARSGLELNTRLPLPVYVLNLDADGKKSGKLRDDNIPSLPMQVFWEGVMVEGWPRLAPDPKRFTARTATHGGDQMEAQFTENSFAIIGREYMLMSLRLGYHFTSIEAMVTENANKNFIRIQYKGGGAGSDRRRRRIYLIQELLERMGFAHTVKSDFIDSRVSHQDRDHSLVSLRQLGQLTILTKQLDMALSNDRVARWYTEDIARKIGLTYTRVFDL